MILSRRPIDDWCQSINGWSEFIAILEESDHRSFTNIWRVWKIFKYMKIKILKRWKLCNWVQSSVHLFPLSLSLCEIYFFLLDHVVIYRRLGDLRKEAWKRGLVAMSWYSVLMVYYDKLTFLIPLLIFIVDLCTGSMCELDL